MYEARMMSMHEKTLMGIVFLSVALAPAVSFAHGAGPLDANGCHHDRRVHDYHCHSGDLRGKHFESRGDMLRMLKSGDDTSISSSHPGRFQDITKGINGEDSDDTAKAQAPAATAAPSGPLATVAPVGPVASVVAPSGRATPAPGSLEERLSVLKRLYERDLITEREYDEKRQQLLDSL